MALHSLFYGRPPRPRRAFVCPLDNRGLIGVRPYYISLQVSAASQKSCSRTEVCPRQFLSSHTPEVPLTSSPPYSRYPNCTPRNCATASNAAASISTVRPPSRLRATTLSSVSRYGASVVQ